MVSTISELERQNAALRAVVEERLASALPMAASLAGCPPAQEAAAACLSCVSKPMPEKLLPPVRVIGLAGHIGAGKTAAAAMIPDAFHLQWADPIYRGLAAMLDVPEEVLRDRVNKEASLAVAGISASPRHMTRTLGTEWGRECIDPNLWVSITISRIRKIYIATGRTVFAVCGTRFPNEAAAVRRHRGEVWWIDRPGLEPGDHTSDTSLTREQCDRIIVNRGTLDDLRRNVEAAWQDFIGGTA